jgi:hypothetical protein
VESVRVVEEPHFDDLAQMAMERDAAIREREEAVARAAEDARAYAAESDARAQAQQELQDRCDTAFVPAESAGSGAAERLHRETWLRLERDELIHKRDELISRVAELEAAAKLAPRANADGEANHAAQAASGGGEQPRGGLTGEERRVLSEAADVLDDRNSHAYGRFVRDLLARSLPPGPEGKA